MYTILKKYNGEPTIYLLKYGILLDFNSQLCSKITSDYFAGDLMAGNIIAWIQDQAQIYIKVRQKSVSVSLSAANGQPDQVIPTVVFLENFF